MSYFFAPPIYSFRVDYPQDLITISFVITTLVINFLVTKVRVEQRDHMRTCETLRDANQRLEVANEALRIENVERKRAEQAQGKANTSLVKSSKQYQASSGPRTRPANRPNSISGFWATAACDWRSFSM